VKFWTTRKPVVRSVGRNARTDIVNTATCPAIANAAALVRRDFEKLKIRSEATNGAAGNSQRLLTIPGFIL
jgi:hypothetical protein